MEGTQPEEQTTSVAAQATTPETEAPTDNSHKISVGEVADLLRSILAEITDKDKAKAEADKLLAELEAKKQDFLLTVERIETKIKDHIETLKK